MREGEETKENHMRGEVCHLSLKTNERGVRKHVLEEQATLEGERGSFGGTNGGEQ